MYKMSCSGSGGDQKEAASTLINTVQKVASQLTPATPVPTPGPTPQANFLNLPNINLQNILSALPGANNGVSVGSLQGKDTLGPYHVLPQAFIPGLTLPQESLFLQVSSQDTPCRQTS